MSFIGNYVSRTGDTLTGTLTGADGSAWSSSGFQVANGKTLGWSDTILNRDAANTLGLRNGGNTQNFYVYKSFTDASNWMRLEIADGTSLASVITNWAGTGTAHQFGFGSGGVQWQVNTSGHFLASSDNVTDIGQSGASRPRNIYASAGITSAGATSGVGYATGSGGAVTQTTSKSTGVTLNTVCGAITMNNAALAAGAKVTFTLTDSAIAATDMVNCCVASGGTANAYRASVTAVAAGSCAITVENITAGSLSEAPVVTFAVTKAVTS